jgi:hypothetical protein
VLRIDAGHKNNYEQSGMSVKTLENESRASCVRFAKVEILGKREMGVMGPSRKTVPK